MRRTMTALSVAGAGLFASVAGQAIWRQSPDEIWAGCAVVGVLLGAAIGFESSISRLLARVMHT
ncbi:MAG: hypothetical protein R2712_05905 [Vicinamibacterales bacterium]